MIRVRFNPDKLTGQDKIGWEKWQQEAQEATMKVIAAYEQWQAQNNNKKFTYPWEDEIWKWLKDFLLERVFHGKCAYCETKEVRSPYHAEHFRPKGMVQYKKLDDSKLHKALCSREDSSQIEHPGYFWLAYDYKNLLPSCAFCNSHEGKKNQFPVARQYLFRFRLDEAELPNLKRPPFVSPTQQGIYYLLSEDIDDLESSLLLNPLTDDPHEHICFGDRGIVAEVDNSAKGLHSISVYNLSDDGLRQARQQAQESGENRFLAAKINRHNASIVERTQAGLDAIQSFIDGKEAYSAAVLDYLCLAGRINAEQLEKRLP